MSIVYDNWEKLVEAVLKREELKRIALCPSFSSSSSADISSRSSNSFHVNSDVVPVGNYVTRAVERGVAARAALIFAYFRRRKPHDHFSYFRRRKPHAHFSYFRRRKPHVHFSDALAEGGPYHLRQLERFSLRELKVATDNFIDRNILGIGDFGKVYKGRLANGSLVAVKRLMKERTPDRELQFKREVEMIPMLAHGNICRLHGFCWTPKEMLLVYPYMANGSVASCLRERTESELPLDWPIRKRIAMGSARGLAYLHDQCDPRIIHRDVTAANILLDEDFEAVVGDFGLAILMDCKDTHVTTDIRGTTGEIDPEYAVTCKVSEKTDVYGYGVMLLELITGLRTSDLVRLYIDDDMMLHDWVKGFLKENRLETIVDADLQGNYIDEEVEQLSRVALLCTCYSPDKRPKMSDVVRMLEGDG